MVVGNHENNPQSGSMEAERGSDVFRSDLEHRERQIEALRHICEALFDHLTVDEILREILRVAIDVLQADVGSLQLHDPQTDSLVFRYVHDPAAADALVGHATPASQGISGSVFKSGVSELTHHVEQHPDFNPQVDTLTGYQTRSMLTVALKRFGGEPIGVIQVLNAKKKFDQGDLEVLEIMCSQAATSLETARLIEQARKAEILNLIGDISHDIKNMLTPIKTGAWTLESVLNDLATTLHSIAQTCPTEEPWGDEVQKVLSKAQADYGSLLELAIHAASRLEARTLEISEAVKGEPAITVFKEANLNDTACHVVSSMRLVAKTAGINLRLDLDAEMPLIEFDPRQIYSALFNLVNNAIQATPAGGTVILRTRGPQDDPKEVLVEVQDNGCGMPPQVRERAFTDSAISTKPGGTGLGTRIVAGVVRRHSGTRFLDSEEGRGTRVSIRLPMKQPASA